MIGINDVGGIMGERMLYFEYLDNIRGEALYSEMNYTIFLKRLIPREDSFHFGEVRNLPWILTDWGKLN